MVQFRTIMALEHLDVLIIGAGLSGIGAAHHLKQQHPHRSVALLEARDEIGGTWSLFKYPGIRSDSDMHTLGFAFRPWDELKTLADGPAILEYLRDTAREDGTLEKIRYGHRVTRASWSSEDALWTVDIEREGAEPTQLTASFLLNCTGYYRYDEGFTPNFEGRDRFEGQIVHPQHWPEDLDYEGKRVVVIGSGATAVTLVPAMVDKAAHVTMLQRSPTYIASVPTIDPVANALRRLPNRIKFPIVRWRYIAQQLAVFNISQKRPEMMKKFFIGNAAKQLPDGYDVGKHFTPSYNPWDQRLCAVPGGDLFRAIRKDQASVVTDRIKTFTEKGIALESGEELEADIIITATGLNLLMFGGIQLRVDGKDIKLPDTVAYKGMMLSGIPNFAYAIGYTNSSWTLKADLVGGYISRLLTHMDQGGFTTAVPELDGAMQTAPLLDFSAGYVQRSVDSLPKAGTKAPWDLPMSYPKDLLAFKRGKIDDGTMQFSTAKQSAPAPAAAAV